MSEEVVQILKIALTIDEVNVILSCLGKQPYESVATLIAKIASQGEQQIAEMQSSEEIID